MQCDIISLNTKNNFDQRWFLSLYQVYFNICFLMLVFKYLTYFTVKTLHLLYFFSIFLHSWKLFGIFYFLLSKVPIKFTFLLYKIKAFLLCQMVMTNSKKTHSKIITYISQNLKVTKNWYLNPELWNKLASNQILRIY